MVSRGMVVKGYGNLNQSLKKLFVFGRCRAPDVFEGFMSVEEFGVVEQGKSLQILGRVHNSIVAHGLRATTRNV